MRPIRLALAIALTLGASACASPAPPPAQHAVASAIAGQVSWSDRTSQAQTSDIANGATVSLLDSSSGQTVGTTVTEANGSFTLNFGSSFRPASGKAYILEAVRGLPVGLSANRAGSSLARIRTLLFFDGTTWKSLSSGSSVSIGPATTAVCILASLRALSTPQQSDLVSKVTGSSFNAAGTALSSSDYTHVYTLTSAAISQDLDPLQVIVYDPAGATPSAQYLFKNRDLVLHDTFSPAKATAGGSATFYGQNLPVTDATVSVGGIPVATWSVSPARTQLTVTLPGNACGGLLELEAGRSTWYGPYLPVTGTVGTLAGSGYFAGLDGTGPTAAFYPEWGSGMVSDSKGNLYISDAKNNRIRKVTPRGAVTTLFGDGVAGYLDGAGTATRFNYPVGITLVGDTTLYIAEAYGYRIRKANLGTGVVTTLAGSICGYADGTGTGAQFGSPTGLAVDASGNVLVADAYNHRIRKVTPDGAVTTLAGSGTAALTDGTGTGAQFNNPNGVALDASGNLYITDTHNHRIRKMTPGLVVTTFAGNSGEFLYPRDIELDAAGNLYVANDSKFKISKVTPAGAVSTLAGSGTGGYLDGSLLSAQFFYPRAIALDPNGNVAVLDNQSARLRLITP